MSLQDQSTDSPVLASFVGQQSVRWLCDKAGITLEELCRRAEGQRARASVDKLYDDVLEVVENHLEVPVRPKKKAKAKKKKKAAAAPKVEAAPAVATKPAKPKASKGDVPLGGRGKKLPGNLTIGPMRVAKHMPGTLSAIAQRLGRKKDEVLKSLLYLQNNGLAVTKKTDEGVVYMDSGGRGTV